MQRQFITSLFASAAFAPETGSDGSTDAPPVTIVPAHTASAPSVSPEPSAAQPIVTIEAARAVTDADAAKRAALAAKLQAKRQAASQPEADASKPEAAKRSNKRNAAKRVASKPEAAKLTPAKPAKPTAEARAKANADNADASRLARAASGRAVGAYYSGRSLPFKSASDRFADLNFSNAKAATTRQAALMLALITYGRGNMRRDGTFTRGAFIVPAKLVNANAPDSLTVRAQPESGCFGNLLGRAGEYVSGPRTGRDQANAVYKLNIPVALAEIQAAFGDVEAKRAKLLVNSFKAA